MPFLFIMIVCLFVFAIDFCIVIYANDFCFQDLSLDYWHILCLSYLLFCIMYGVFNQFVFLILCLHCFYL